MAGPDMSQLQAAADFGNLAGTLLGVLAIPLALHVVNFGIRMLFRALNSGEVTYQRYSYSHEYDDATFKSIMRNGRRKNRRGF